MNGLQKAVACGITLPRKDEDLFVYAVTRYRIIGRKQTKSLSSTFGITRKFLRRCIWLG